MQTLTQTHFQSSVLIVGAPGKLKLAVGADMVANLAESLEALHSRDYDVVVVPLATALQNEFQNHFFALRKRNPAAQIIVINDKSPVDDALLLLTNSLHIAAILQTFERQTLDDQVFKSLERAQQEQQNSQLETLIQEQNNKLKSLYQELEDRIEKRQRFLEESRRKTAVANLRWASLREAMIAIHQALSVREMEKNLTNALATPLQLSLTRIFFKPHDTYFANQNKTHHSFAVFQAPLFRLQQPIGSMFFLREPTRAFNRDESEFLLRISEAVSLALDRLSHLEQSETLREQWQATFNAISDPVVLITRDYDVIQSNASARERSTSSGATQKCYQMLFHRESPCTHCQLGKDFRLESRSEILDVSSQPVENHFINLYHDISAQLRMERKILESARLAELGTIGSSIAHELNNPLGGILSFVQLIRMDLKADSTLMPDIIEMEEGVKRCRDIVQNLLSFTRNPEVDTISDMDLKDVILRSIKIVELQTKSQNIEIKSLLPESAALFRGHSNMLSQAVKNLLQLSIDSLVEKIHSQPGSSAVIEISLESNENSWIIKILDNGPGANRRKSLPFSISTQIIHEHEGSVEIFSQPRQMTMAKISLPQVRR